MSLSLSHRWRNKMYLFIYFILNTPSDIITVGLVCKARVDVNTENFSTAVTEKTSSHDPNIKTYIIGDLNINLLSYGSFQRI